MKNNWNEAVLEELDINETAYSMMRTTNVDGSYTSNDGKFTSHTYGPSGANSGTPGVGYNEKGEPEAIMQ